MLKLPAQENRIAYFSMEIALQAEIQTYSGGLGVLAGDTIRSAADLKIPMVAVTLLHRKGYFRQRLDASGWQNEEPAGWSVETLLEEMPGRAAVTLEGRTVHLRSWRYEVCGSGGSRVPVYLLDADLPENSDWDRTLTHYLYVGDELDRLCQEVILGIGGVRMLRAMGFKGIDRFHMNEGHPSLLALELLDEEARRAGRQGITHDDVEAVRKKCVFTTHTPLPAGQDHFPRDLVDHVLDRREVDEIRDVFYCGDHLDMTFLALNLSHYVHGVARKHGEISRLLFAGYTIDAITNGVHAATWATEPFSRLYDRYVSGWRQDNFSLRYALSIPKQEIWQAHALAKKSLMHWVNSETNTGMDGDRFTIGCARRAATDKRADLLFSDIERLKAIASRCGGLQIVYAGKAHPLDQAGKEQIESVFRARDALRDNIKIAYLE